jgi:SNF2 family DNA or RNA helicase
MPESGRSRDEPSEASLQQALDKIDSYEKLLENSTGYPDDLPLKADWKAKLAELHEMVNLSQLQPVAARGFSSLAPQGHSMSHQASPRPNCYRPAEHTTLPTRKRPFSGEHDYGTSKSRRATPSPAPSTATTPPSTESEFDDILSSLLGADFKQEYKEYEREQQAWDERQEQEKRDAELAQSIQDSWNYTNEVSSGPQPNFLVQTSLGSNIGTNQTMPPPPRPELKPSYSTPVLKSEQLPANPYMLPPRPSRSGEGSSSASDYEELFSLPAGPSTYINSGSLPSLLPWEGPQSNVVPHAGGSSVYRQSLDNGSHSTYRTPTGPGAPYDLDPLTYRDLVDTSPRKSSTFVDLTDDAYQGPLTDSGLNHCFPEYTDPGQTHEELKSLLANIRPDEEISPQDREGTPEAMKCILMEHQKLGLAWMKDMEDASSKGGILADDMGLGKTVQALSLIVSRKSDNPACKTTLIVAPVALMGQWAREVLKLVKRGKHSLTVETLHANTRDLQWSKLQEKDIVLTTYGTLASEVKRKHAWDEKLRRVPNARPSRGENLPLLGERSRWYRVILDEAQWIKNKSTKTAIAAGFLHAKYRWCLTGTPMQNSVDELYSLIRFLRIAPYKSFDKFSRDFSRPLKAKISYGGSKENAMRQLQALCKAIMLRRTKQSSIDGKPILQLPEKTIIEQYATFSKDEQDFYAALESKAQITFNRYLNAGTVGRNYSNALVLLLRLRQACCHPHLIKDIEMETEGDSGATAIDKLANAHMLSAEVVDRIKQVEAFECPICFDAAINSLIFNPCGHPSCHECFDRLATQAHANADNEAGSHILCPSCRGRVDPTKLTDLNSFRQAFDSVGGKPGQGKDALAALAHGLEGKSDGRSDDDSDSDSDSNSDTDSVTDGEGADDVNDRGNLAGFVVSDGEEDIENDERGDGKGKSKGKSKSETRKMGNDKSNSVDWLTQLGEGSEQGAGGNMQHKKRGRRRRKDKGKSVSTDHLSLAQLRKEGLKSKAAKKMYLRRLSTNWQTSAKIEKAVELLDAIEAKGTEEKTIVFSQFTSLLDLLEVPLARKEVSYRRYDGSMKRQDREEAVMAFTDDPSCRVLLVSLKAGNSGLNLTAASQVIIFDPHWNWYVNLPDLGGATVRLTHFPGTPKPKQ